MDVADFDGQSSPKVTSFTLSLFFSSLLLISFSFIIVIVLSFDRLKDDETIKPLVDQLKAQVVLGTKAPGQAADLILQQFLRGN